jgi:predicted amidohydrolase
LPEGKRLLGEAPDGVWQAGPVSTPGSLRLALVQQASTLEAAENRAAVTAVGERLEPDTGLVLFPEAFMCDFGPRGSDVSHQAEPLDGPFVEHLTGFAEQHATTVVAGIFETSEDPSRPYNTVVVVDRGGLRASYRKIHLYDSFGFRESDRLLAGPLEPLVVAVEGMSVGVMTCYDLRFPELARGLVDRGAELLVLPSAWVAGPGKVEHWRTLVLARAIENTVFVAAAGQPGPRYTGHSLVAGPAGEVIAEVGDGDHVLVASVARTRLEEARAENPSLANRRFPGPAPLVP